MKLFAILISIMLLPLAYAMEDQEAGLDAPLAGEVDLAIAEELEEFADREDRMERCIRKLQSRFPNKEARAEFACKNFYQNYDYREAAKLEIKEAGVDGELVAKLARLREERREKIQALDEELRDRLAKLDADELERISSLKAARLERIEELDDAQLGRLAKLTRAQLREYEEDDDWEERLKNTISARGKVDDVGRKRALTEERIKESKENYERAQERFKNRKEKYEEAKELFRELIAEERDACREEGDECDEARDATIEKAKQFLKALGEQEIAYLEDLIAQIEGNEGYTNSDAEKQVTSLQEQITKIETAIELLDEAETKGEVKDAGQVIINTWKRMEIQALDYREELAYRTAKSFIRRGEALEIKLDKLVARAEEAGIDVSEVDEKIEEFSEQISLANEHLEKGEEYFVEFRNADKPDRELLSKAKEEFKKAHEALGEANNILKEIKRIIFGLTGEDFEEDDDEIVEIIMEREEPIPDSPEFTEEVAT